ncbi:hypothetical protein I79_021332 [Cricetulus griseus]|uniref:Uncharacterized protein n=1 Tax=Cricetulus griseus TaxID=10029 RepID=G3ICD9_CRIGR|nr:hypothetical protein I79_021332 [Cricetulus griseus]
MKQLLTLSLLPGEDLPWRPAQATDCLLQSYGPVPPCCRPPANFSCAFLSPWATPVLYKGSSCPPHAYPTLTAPGSRELGLAEVK